MSQGWDDLLKQDHEVTDEVQRELFNFTIIKPFRNEDLINIIKALEIDYPGKNRQGAQRGSTGYNTAFS